MRKKKQIVIDLLYNQGAPQLLAGVEEILTLLVQQNKKRCVVTHSSRELVEILQKHHPILKTIPNWITRENYTKPKPDPEGVL